MTAVDYETSPQHTQSKSGNKKQSDPHNRNSEKGGKQTIKPEKKQPEECATPALAGGGTAPERKVQKKGKQTIKPKETVKEASNVSSHTEKGVEAATEGKVEDAGTRSIEPLNEKSNAPLVQSDKGKNMQTTTARSKSKAKGTRKGQPKVKTKRLPKGQPRGQKAKRKRMKGSSKPKSEETKMGNVPMLKITKKAKRRGKMITRRQISIEALLELPNQVGVARGPKKYRLARVESDSKHRQRVLTNRKLNRRGRRAKSKQGSQRKEFGEYGGNYWSKSEADLVELSSIECGSYEDKMDVPEEKNPTIKKKSSGQYRQMRYQKRGEVEWGNGIESEDQNYLLEFPRTLRFKFNPSAPEFVPQESTEKESTEKESNEKTPVIFTVSELLKSVKGKKLPTMPTAQPYIMRRNS